MHIHVIQPALPTYRIDYFDRVARMMGPNYTVHYSVTDFGALTTKPLTYPWERPVGAMRTLIPGLQWQDGVLWLPMHRDDIVVISGGPRCLSNMALLVRAWLKGVRTIWWGHYWSASSRPWRMALRLMLMRLSTAVLFYTDAEIAEYQKNRPGERRLISALNNGINTDTIQAHRVPYKADERAQTMLFIGRVTPKAQLGLLIQAMADPALPNANLHVIGGGGNEDELKAQARHLGVDARITWHGGKSDEAEIAEIANRCALFVYPGSVGLSLVHAMAYGLPAIVHDDRWQHMPEIAAFEDKTTGQTFHTGNAGSLAQAISAALGDAPGLERWSAAALKRTETGFNTAAMAQRFCDLIEKLQAGRSR